MECNREEAIKAREFAEMKLQNGDFQGAQKLALKASKLFPGPDENISQVLIVCDVLCAAQNNNIVSEKDWYGILQTGGIVDESTIKRQYRKLALLLHPDKNKFAGAEAAFKLIGEANTFLLEHEKKSLYDRRYRAFKRNVVPQSPARQVYQSDRNSDGSGTFWTICSSCDIKFKYFRAIENKRMRCPVCKQEYVAYDLNAQSARQSSQSTAVGSEGLAPASSSCESERICSVKGKRKVQTEKQDEEVIYEESVQTAPKQNTNNQNISSCRRYSRQKLNVSNNEDQIADDFPGFAQRSVGSKSGFAQKHEKIYVSPKASSVPDDAESAPKVDTFLIPEIYKCPDPEFSYFDINKDEETFCVNQIWACYDSVDGMPRFYAHIRKVLSSPFVLIFTWLEPTPEDESAINWASVLPISCGRFYPGATEETSDRLIFSHQVKFEKCSYRGSYFIYPRKGEIWAVFSDWDIGWSSDPESHKPFRCDVVEIFSDLHQGIGIDVCCLSKVEGFVSLYERSIKNGKVTHVIPPNELLRFSHKVPFNKLSGTEREGVPAGSFELDPAALPSIPCQLLQPGEVKMKTQTSPEKVNSKIKGEIVNPRYEEAVVSERIPSIHIDENRSNREIFYDFEMDSAIGNFSRGQIWAMYSRQTRLPKIYGQIKKVESSKLLTALLEPCSSKDQRSCGIFQVSAEKPQVFFPSSFSHVKDVEYISQGIVEIYPKKGEVWAIYKNWGAGMLQENPLYDIVEVCRSNENCVEVWLLEHFSGTRSVFKHQKEERRYKITLKIPRDKLLRFSHQIPAFKLTGQKDGFLRGFWELDPASVPRDAYCNKA
ncbi:J domain-containing protein [Heracleum sosnowskyi]|uniref:J domain-containing protein n=1 Tax=Heracleum sosnowskyi TaxID=360622 RepID=A0AAD8MSW0_9APIA|nr:J domain-containing protein [Heracleum sosnowskyi]